MKNPSKSIEKILKDFHFFEGMGPKHLKKVVSLAKQVTFEAGTQIFQQGETADHFYLLTDGRAAIELYSPDRGGLLMETLEGGDILGWSWLVPPHQWRFNAQAVVQTHAVAIDGVSLRKLCKKDCVLGYAVLEKFLPIVTDRLEAARIRLLDLYGLPKGGRV